MKRHLLFAFGLLLLVVTEILRIYFIMPFPGSQESDTIDIAYFLHCYIWLFRVTALLLIVPPFYNYWKGGRRKQKIISSIFLGLVLAIVYLTNFIMQADKMFRQPKHQVFSSVAENKVDEQSIIIGVAINGEAKAVPINVIGYHHRITDSVGGVPVMFAYCTVCRSGRAFSPMVNGKDEQFRLVGMDHYDAMFEDATTGSWWRQENGEAITGKLKGKFLDEIPSHQMTLKQWIAEHPGTKILQPDPDFLAEYDMLRGYDYGLTKNELEYTDRNSWQMKSWVVGVVADKKEKAYDWNDLKKLRMINDTIQNTPVLLMMENDSMSFHAFSRKVNNRILWFTLNENSSSLTDSSTHSVWNSRGACVEGEMKGAQLTSVPAYLEYWHSWKQFHPKSSRYLLK